VANEFTYVGAGADLRLAEIFNSEVWLNLSDGTDIRNLCTRMRDMGGAGSDTMQAPYLATGDAMAAANADEVTASGNTLIADGQYTVTIAQQIISFTTSDLFAITAGAGMAGMADLARQAARAYVLRATDMITTVAAGFTATVGTTTVDLTVDDIYSAQYQLTASSVPGGSASCVLYPTQLTDFQNSLRSEGGAVQWESASADMLAAKGPGYSGRWHGIDFFSSDSVPTANAGADSAGAMFNPRGVVFAEASAAASMPGSVAAAIPAGSPVYAEFSRQADPGLSSLVAHAFVGVALAEDGAGVSIITDR